MRSSKFSDAQIIAIFNQSEDSTKHWVECDSIISTTSMEHNNKTNKVVRPEEEVSSSRPLQGPYIDLYRNIQTQYPIIKPTNALEAS